MDNLGSSAAFVQAWLDQVIIVGHKAGPDLTPACSKPEMAELIPLADASRTKALDEAAQKGKALAARLAA